VIAWGTLSEHAAETLAKGDRVIVHGRLNQREWTTETGEKRSAWEITADEIGPSLRHGLPGQGGASAAWDDQIEYVPAGA
jgi:single-stranded DNA-binding protein